MQAVNTKTVVQVTVEFTEEEWALLEGGTDVDYLPDQYIHDATIGKLKRAKAKKVKKESKHEN